MLKNIFCSLLFLALFSCSNDSNDGDSCRMTSIMTLSSHIDDVPMANLYNPNFSGRLHFEYGGNNKIKKVYGGLRIYYNTSGQGPTITWRRDDSVVDSITYHQDTIRVDCSSNGYDKPYVKKFVINNNQLVYRSTLTNTYNTTYLYEYTYEYNGDTILENLNGQLFRTFTMSNGNLVKIEQINRGGNGNIVGKKEMIYSNYDNAENLAKGKFFINGLLHKSFSANNYQSYEIIDYYYENNEYVPGNTSYLNFIMSYDSDNLPIIFERNCS